MIDYNFVNRLIFLFVCHYCFSLWIRHCLWFRFAALRHAGSQPQAVQRWHCSDTVPMPADSSYHFMFAWREMNARIADFVTASFFPKRHPNTVPGTTRTLSISV